MSLLLFSQHGELVFAKLAFAVGAEIETFFVAVTELTNREVQVADTTAGSVGLAGYLAIMLEEFRQRANHRLKVEGSLIIAASSYSRHRASVIVDPHFTTVYERTAMLLPSISPITS